MPEVRRLPALLRSVDQARPSNCRSVLGYGHACPAPLRQVLLADRAGPRLLRLRRLPRVSRSARRQSRSEGARRRRRSFSAPPPRGNDARIAGVVACQRSPRRHRRVRPVGESLRHQCQRNGRFTRRVGRRGCRRIRRSPRLCAPDYCVSGLVGTRRRNRRAPSGDLRPRASDALDLRQRTARAGDIHVGWGLNLVVVASISLAISGLACLIRSATS